MQPSSAPSACPRSPAAPAAVSQEHPASTLTTTGKLIPTLTDPAGKVVNSVAFGPDGNLAAGDFNGATDLWNITTGKVTATLTAPVPAADAFIGDSVRSVAFGPDGILAVGDSIGSTYLWHITYG